MFGGTASHDAGAKLRASGRGRGVEAFTQHRGHARRAPDARLEEGSWRSAGPIRPGYEAHAGGIFLAGNAAGEAHPVVAEGISMAMQSSSLLVRRLLETTVAGKHINRPRGHVLLP